MLSLEDQTGVNRTIDGISDAWNRHDMDAYGTFLTDDCDWVNVVGMHWSGKAQVLKAHRAFHATMFKETGVHELGRQLGYVAPGVAIAVITFTLDDYTEPSGTLMSNVHDCITYILVKQHNRWLIRSAHNTTTNLAAAKHDPGK